MSDKEESVKKIPTIVRHKADTRTLAQPINSDQIAGILNTGVKPPKIPKPTAEELKECPPSPTLFPLTEAQFGHDGSCKRIEDEDLYSRDGSSQSFNRSPVMVRIPTPAIPEDISPIPTPMALGVGVDDRLTEDEAAKIDIWAFREALPPAAHPFNHTQGPLRQLI